MQARAIAMAIWVFTGAGAADQDDVALMGEEVAAGEVAYQGLVDRRLVEGEVVDILGKRQLGDGDLVLDRARLLLGDLGGVRRSPTMLLGLVLPFDGGGDDSRRRRPSCRRA